jgi:long-chain acyl-CoA synthetase
MRDWGLEDIARFASKRIFLDDAGRLILYQDVLDFSKSLSALGVGRKLVLCMLDNELDGLMGYLALLGADAVPMMVSPNLAADALHDLVRNYQPDFVWLPLKRKAEWPTARQLICAQTYGLLVQEKVSHETELHPALCLLLSTSGSTGSGKYVRLSKQNVWTNAQAIASYLKLTQDEMAVTTLPPTYSYGLSILHSHLWVGAGLAVTSKTFFDRGFWSFLRDARVSSLAGVPYHYEILKKLRFTKMELPYIRTLTQAGGHMPANLTREYAELSASRGWHFFTMYGQTEASPRMSYVPAEMALEKAGTIGMAIPGGVFSLEDDEGRVLKGSKVVGELVYRGANVCMGYAQNRVDLSLGDVNNGILHTGDMAQCDEDGFYSIVGRKTRFIKLFGNRINLQYIEHFLATLVSDVACSGCDDMLEIYFTAGTAPLALEIKKKVADRLKVNSQSIAVYGVVALPRNEAGKVLYVQLHPDKAQFLA